jgi:hypothetical protein
MGEMITASIARQKARELRELALKQINGTARHELKSVADEYEKLAKELEATRDAGRSG